MAGVAADSLASNTRVTPEPHALCMIVRSYSEVYRDSLFRLNLPNDPAIALDSIFKYPYDSLLALILDRSIPEYPNGRLDSIPVRMLTDTFRIQFQTDPNFYFRKLLAYNSLYDWTPQMPVNFVHSPVDIENPLSNVEFVMQLFEDSGATDIQLSLIAGNLSHGDAGLPYVLFALDYMRGKRVDCLTGINDNVADGGLDWNIYPNPAQEQVNITYELGKKPAQLNVYSSSGAIVKAVVLNDSNTVIDVATLAAGNYVMELAVGQNRYYRVLIKK